MGYGNPRELDFTNGLTNIVICKGGSKFYPVQQEEYNQSYPFQVENIVFLVILFFVCCTIVL